MGKRVYYQKEGRLEKLSKDDVLDLTFDLVNAFGQIRSSNNAADIIKDLLTADEIKDLAKRLRIAKLLLSKASQREIATTVHCSLATVTKVSIWLQQSDGNLEKIISKLPTKYKMPKNLPKIPIEFQAPQALLATAKYILASNQNRKLNTFMQKVESKKLTDKLLKKLLVKSFDLGLRVKVNRGSVPLLRYNGTNTDYFYI